MPTFNTYPALQVRTFDIQDIQRRGLQNQGLQSKLQREMSGQLTPEQQLGRDRLQVSKGQLQLSQDKDERARQNEYAADVARRIEPLLDSSLSDVEVISRYNQILSQAQADQIPGVENAPPLGSPAEAIRAWANNTQAQAGQFKTEHERLGTLSAPAFEQQVDLARAKGEARPSNRRYQTTGPYVDSETGEYLGEGFYDKRKNELTLKRGSKTVPMPENAMPRTEGGLIKGAMTGQQFHGLASEAAQEEKSLRELGRYMKNVQSTEQGWALLADQLLGALNTVFDGDLTPVQYRTLLQNGQLQGMLGGARLETVGPGVMTEQDVERIIARLGGDVGLLRNREIAGQLIKEIMMEKVERYNNVTLPQYNYQTNIIPRGGFKEKKSIEIDESIFAPSQATAPDSGLSAEDEALVEKYSQ